MPRTHFFRQRRGEAILPLPCTSGICAGLAHGVLDPDILDDLNAIALVIRVIAGEVAIGEQPTREVAARETEFLPVAHLGEGADEMASA